MQEKLTDGNPIARQVPLKRSYVVVAALPEVVAAHGIWQLLLLEVFRVDPHDQHFFVVGTVEDSDFAARRHAAVRAPKKIVGQFLCRRRLERMYIDALRIHARHDVLDGAVFSGGVHRLHDDQQTPGALCVEHLLQLGEQRNALLQPLFGFRLVFRVQVVRVVWPVILQPKILTGSDDVGFDEFAAVLQFWCCHFRSWQKTMRFGGAYCGRAALDRRVQRIMPPTIWLIQGVPLPEEGKGIIFPSRISNSSPPHFTRLEVKPASQTMKCTASRNGPSHSFFRRTSSPMPQTPTIHATVSLNKR